MASNSALTLVNRILSTTGDYSALASLVGSPAAIADRIIDFLNIALSEVEQVSEWPELREEASKQEFRRLTGYHKKRHLEKRKKR